MGRGKQHVFSQYPHPLAPGASKHGFGNISGTMGCAGGNGPPYVCKAVMGYSMRTPVRPSTRRFAGFEFELERGRFVAA